MEVSAPYRIAWRGLGVQAGGLRVHRLELHRHVQRRERLRTHAHAFWQSILYLGGRGWEEVEGREPVAVGAGSLLLIPPGVRHGFLREKQRPPFCLVADFELVDPPECAVRVTRFEAPELGRIRRLLAPVSNRAAEREPDRWEQAGIALQVVSLQLAATGWWGEAPGRPLSPVAIKTERILKERLAEPESLQKVAAAIGYCPDHLNRVLRQEVGWTLGEWRSLLRLELAKRRLGEPGPVAEIAAACGMFDQNYFARWFRKATGYSPTEWRRHGGHPPHASARFSASSQSERQ